MQLAYPKARIVIGGNDDLEILEREAAWADIVAPMYAAYSSFVLKVFMADTINYYDISVPAWRYCDHRFRW